MNIPSTHPTFLRDVLARQLAMAWQLTCHHLDGQSVEECLWRPADRGLHVHRAGDGAWHGDWPEHERYDLGPSSLAWLTWHLGFWWAMALDHNSSTLRARAAEPMRPISALHVGFLTTRPPPHRALTE